MEKNRAELPEALADKIDHTTSFPRQQGIILASGPSTTQFGSITHNQLSTKTARRSSINNGAIVSSYISKAFLSATAASLFLSSAVFAQQLVTFDGISVSGTSLTLDLNSDAQPDLVISSPSNTNLALSNQGNTYSFTQEPSLYHPGVTGPELRIDFPNRLDGEISFDVTTGWLCGSSTGEVGGASLSFTVELFQTGNAVAVDSTTAIAECFSAPTKSDYAEQRIRLGSGTTSDYAIIDYNDATPDPVTPPVMTIDNLSGLFIPAARPLHGVPALPLPALISLMVLIGILATRFRSKH